MAEAKVDLSAVVRVRKPMEPVATEVPTRLDRLDRIQAVVFDIYGTLLISGTGDVGSVDPASRPHALREAFASVGWLDRATALPDVRQLHQQIEQMNAERRCEDCPQPEVDIIEAWRRTLAAAALPELAQDTAALVTLSAEYEARTNPTWPMPGAREAIEVLAAAGLALGVVSNAQAFTLPLLEDLIGGAPEDCGFDLNLCIYSYRYRQAKPGSRLFDALTRSLQRRGVLPQHTLYVGNDMLNDVWAASRAGLRTAWFVGDRRSCRPRADDQRCRALTPDLVLDDWSQLPGCLGIK